jgi:hypothetical protein
MVQETGQLSQQFPQINSLRMFQRLVIQDGLSSAFPLFTQMDKLHQQQHLEFQESLSKQLFIRNPSPNGGGFFIARL